MPSAPRGLLIVAAGAALTPPSADLVAGTSLAGKNLECAYLASRDGWGASDFHRCVDDCGSTLVVCETRGGGMALVDQINKAHGEGPDQGRIAEEGNAYLDAEFPGLSYIVSMRLADSLGAE